MNLHEVDIVKKLNQFLNVLMGSFLGAFIGATIMNYREYLHMPDIYEMHPAPWYCYGTLTSFLLFVAVVVICVIIKIIIHRYDKKQ